MLYRIVGQKKYYGHSQVHIARNSFSNVMICGTVLGDIILNEEYKYDKSISCKKCISYLHKNNLE